MREKPTTHSVCVVFSDVVHTYHVTRYKTPIHNIIPTAPQFSISQNAQGTHPEDGNVIPKHVGNPHIINKLNNNCVYVGFSRVFLLGF
jgi:hypothetical protein